MSLDDTKKELSDTLDEVEAWVTDVPHEQTDNIIAAVKYFREVLDHESATEDYLAMIGWAINIGVIWGSMKAQVPIIVVEKVGLDLDDLEMEKPEEVEN